MRKLLRFHQMSLSDGFNLMKVKNGAQIIVSLLVDSL